MIVALFCFGSATAECLNYRTFFGQFELDGGGCGQLQVMGGRIHPPLGPAPGTVRSRRVSLPRASFLLPWDLSEDWFLVVMVVLLLSVGVGSVAFKLVSQHVA